MQVQFDPKDIDLSDAALLLGLIVLPFVKSCRSQGDTLAEIQAGIAEIIQGAWQQAEASDQVKS